MKRLVDRSLIRIEGADARSFLQGVVTQEAPAQVDGARFSALLSPQGKILFDFILVPTPGGYLVDCAASLRDALLKRLSLYRLRAAVEIAAESALAVGFAESEDDARGATHAFVDPRTPQLKWRVIAPAESMAGDGGDAYRDLRFRIGAPQCGDDFATDSLFLLDVNYDALNGVSYSKGCFVGQEVSSRMKRKGEIRKRTLMAASEGAPLARELKLTRGEEAIGEILSAHGTRALALVRTDRLAAASGPVLCEGAELHLMVPPYLETP
jgi:hypothetical protein